MILLRKMIGPLLIGTNQRPSLRQKKECGHNLALSHIFSSSLWFLLWVSAPKKMEGVGNDNDTTNNKPSSTAVPTMATKVTTTRRKVRQESNFMSRFKINLSPERRQSTPAASASPDGLIRAKEEEKEGATQRKAAQHKAAGISAYLSKTKVRLKQPDSPPDASHAEHISSQLSLITAKVNKHSKHESRASARQDQEKESHEKKEESQSSSTLHVESSNSDKSNHLSETAEHNQQSISKFAASFRPPSLHLDSSSATETSPGSPHSSPSELVFQQEDISSPSSDDKLSSAPGMPSDINNNTDPLLSDPLDIKKVVTGLHPLGMYQN